MSFNYYEEEALIRRIATLFRKRYLGLEIQHLLLFGALIIASFLLGLSQGMISAIGFLLFFGIVFNFVGDRIPVWKDWLGGGIVFTVFAAAIVGFLNTKYNFIPKESIDVLQNFLLVDDFLIFFIALLIVGSILGMERRALFVASYAYIPVILIGIAATYLVAGGLAVLTGFGSFWDGALLIAQPVMGGGLGAGVIPTADIYASRGTHEVGYYLTIMFPIAVLGNVSAIFDAAILHRIGEKIPWLSGNGRLEKPRENKKVEEIHTEPMEYKPKIEHVGAYLIIVAGFFAAGQILGKIVPIHPYALMIITVCLFKIFNVLPREIEVTSSRLLSMAMVIFMPILMAGLGLVMFSPGGEGATALTILTDPRVILIAIAVVLTSIIVCGLAGIVFRLYFIESAISAGLCMSNMGGAGDLIVLAASHRLETLLPFAQISSRIGGGIMLIFASILMRFWT